jgi:mycothiol synthase
LQSAENGDDPPERGAIKPVSGRAADLDRTNPGGGNLVGLILHNRYPQRQALPQDFVVARCVSPGETGPVQTAPERGADTVRAMRRVDIVRLPSGAQRDEMTGFVERLAARRGSRPLSDHLWLDLRDGGGDGFIAATVTDSGGMLALAQISAANEGGVLEVVLDDDLPDPVAVHEDVLETVVDAFRRDGGGPLTWWVDDDAEPIRAAGQRVGLNPTRALHEMRVGLPLGVRAEVVTRGFRPDDAEAWVRVNNRAFADHGEQGGWTTATLALRTGEPWFDPDGFRIHDHDGELVAFCWTKVHDETTPPIGEIYVIGVDPAFQGRGLGRQLTLAGLDWLTDHGIATANLYVDAGNVGAVRLYEQLGFEPHHTRFAFAGTLESLDPPTGAT